jgi:AcrR family transcriptional regulator
MAEAAAVNGMGQRRRTSRAAANDERILDAALELVDEHGVDQLSLRDVAEAVGLTHGALYSRYDNVAELLVDLWQQRSVAEMEQLVIAAATRGLTAPEPDDPVWSGPPTARRRVAVVLCLVAERIDELAEVIPRDLRELMVRHSLIRSDSTFDAIGLGHLCSLIGYCVECSVHTFPPEDVVTTLEWLRRGSDPAFTGRAPEPWEPQQIVFSTGDPMRDAVLQACSAVVARSGMHRATLKRIGRAAGCVPSLVYNWYESREELMLDMVRRGVEMTAVPSGQEMFGRIEAGPSLAAGWAEPSALVRRRIPLEMYLGAMHNRRLADVIRDLLAQHHAVVAGGLAPPGAEIQRMAVLMLRQGNVIASGISVLADLVPGLNRVDWRPYSGAILRGAFRSVADALDPEIQSSPAT